MKKELILIALLIGCVDDTRPTQIENYEQARPMFWQQLYANGGQTLYCGQRFHSYNRKGINIDHIFPMSWVKNSFDCETRTQCRISSEKFNQIEADLHNLYPSLSVVNKQRSTFRFGEVKGESRKFGKKCDFEVNQQLRVAEPAVVIRGEIARAMFYMAYQYRDSGLKLFKKQSKLLHKWHLQDPPDDAEKQRNNKIKRIQGNENPFVSRPDYLTKLYKSGGFD